ncbi:class 1 fructose-bisphosphatase [Henriciella marina]|uniref:class 1 fructose-bisphosphatase n=1 Tax=Henriciella marina TaxID=453851 RepID=UPI000369783E|nr:class 1 fructose-bisphosphatase [Henriciella marina]
MSQSFQSQLENMDGIYAALFSAAEEIYAELKKGVGLKFATSSNESGDDQIEMDVIADEAFFNALKEDGNVRYVVSEERPGLNKISDGPYSVALDPLDGSKSALVGIPSGAIFAIFENAETAPDFNGKNIVSGGFFVFGMNLEVYFADGDKVYGGIFDGSDWSVLPIEGGLPSAEILSINAQNQTVWDEWLQRHYACLFDTKGGREKPQNMRWYASMVADMKRMVLQGGLFAYPSANIKGYEEGKLRLVYEAIPMAFLIKAMGGSSTDGERSLLEVPVETLHQKTPVFIGEKAKIDAVEAARKA